MFLLKNTAVCSPKGARRAFEDQTCVGCGSVVSGFHRKEAYRFRGGEKMRHNRKASLFGNRCGLNSTFYSRLCVRRASQTTLSLCFFWDEGGKIQHTLG